MQPQAIAADRFWDLYFRDRFLELRRGPAGYSGLVASEGPAGAPAKVLALEPDPVSVAISADALRAHDYAADGRFFLITRRPARIDLAIAAVIDGTYPYREPAPFGKARMAELATMVQAMLLMRDDLSLPALEALGAEIVENHAAADGQLLAAIAWFLGEQRQRSSAGTLVAIAGRGHPRPTARPFVASSTADAALSALWKVNDKASLWSLLELADRSPGAIRKIAPLCARLLSTETLLGIHALDEAYLRPDHWRSLLEPMRQFTDAEWDMRDCESLFWELRYTAAQRLAPDSRALLAALSRDEVGTVRDAAQARLGGT